jgi:uncharacterized protein (TIGR00369 family)
MNNLIEINDHQFANSQVSCDLRDNSHATESETQIGPVAPEEIPAPIGKLLGLTIISSGAGRATIGFQASARYANPMGTLHGGVLCDLADAAMGIAYRSMLAEDETFTTIELKINFLRPVWNAKLRAQAKVIHAGKSVALIECDIFDERDRLVARASSTCMKLRGRLAEGRQLPRNQPMSKQIDADERIAGYLREPNQPQFESRRAGVFSSSINENPMTLNNMKHVRTK